jgi:hypothetical protein
MVRVPVPYYYTIQRQQKNISRICEQGCTWVLETSSPRKKGDVLTDVFTGKHEKKRKQGENML